MVNTRLLYQTTELIYWGYGSGGNAFEFHNPTCNSDTEIFARHRHMTGTKKNKLDGVIYLL